MADSPLSTKLESNVPEVLRPIVEPWNAALNGTLEFMFSQKGVECPEETMGIMFDIVLQVAAGIFAPAQFDRRGRKEVERRFARALLAATETFTEDYEKFMGEGVTRQ